MARVLVVEDDKLVGRAYKWVFRGRAEVDVVETAEDAMAMLRDRAYSLVLADFRLGPGANGLDVLAYAQTVQPACRRALVTGAHVGPDGRPFATTQTVLLKPVGRATLLGLLSEDSP